MNAYIVRWSDMQGKPHSDIFLSGSFPMLSDVHPHCKNPEKSAGDFVQKIGMMHFDTQVKDLIADIEVLTAGYEPFKLYKVSGSDRENGAIGIFENFVEYTRAESEDHARHNVSMKRYGLNREHVNIKKVEKKG